MRLPSPTADLGDLCDQLGQALGVSRPECIAQYLAWSEKSGLIAALAAGTGSCPADLLGATTLNDHGTDALLSILLALKLVRHSPNGDYKLTELAGEYLVPGRPYYAGDALFEGRARPIPRLFLSNDLGDGADVLPSGDAPATDRNTRLRRQHGRNFSAAVVAARAGGLAKTRHLIDVGGGSGVFAIPLALDNPAMKITLVDFPDALKGIRDVLEIYSVEERISLLGMDVMKEEWTFPTCDGILFGNFFHSFDDASCAALARRSYAALSPGGSIWLHEVLFNENRNGPLIAALWNANMLALRAGARQRTSRELKELLYAAGFEHYSATPTATNFWLVRAVKPNVCHGVTTG